MALATIKLNLGRGDDNPVLVIMPGDDIPSLVLHIIE